MTSSERMTALALRFPTLRTGAPGVTPWDPDKLDHWGSSPEPSVGGRHAARFVLAVWGYSRRWKSGPFNLIPAVGVWDKDHLEALRAWLHAPWLP